MAAAASEIPDDLLPMIRAARTSTTAIRELIEERQIESKKSIITVGEINEITANIGGELYNLGRPIRTLKSIARNGYTLNKDDPRKDICNKVSSIVRLYPSLNMIAMQVVVEGTNQEDTTILNKTQVNAIYDTMLRPLREMEREWNDLIAEIEATRAGQAVNHRGGYRKRKQRTQRKQRKQRKQHKQKHCKTQRKRR
jgi:hypothetical protein